MHFYTELTIDSRGYNHTVSKGVSVFLMHSLPRREFSLIIMTSTFCWFVVLLFFFSFFLLPSFLSVSVSLSFFLFLIRSHSVALAGSELAKPTPQT